MRRIRLNVGAVFVVDDRTSRFHDVRVLTPAMIQAVIAAWEGVPVESVTVSRAADDHRDVEIEIERPLDTEDEMPW